MPQAKSLQSKLDNFLDGINTISIYDRIPADSELTPEDFERQIRLYANESKAALPLVIDKLDPSKKILEVGAGLCLFSLFLKQQGYAITALEPASTGFNQFEAIKEAILSEYSFIGLDVYDIPAESLTPESHGTYDLIFSNNVIEHIASLKTALSSMNTVMSPDGEMIHGCPNYFVPYEPHFGLPVLFFWPQLSHALFMGRIKERQALWKSLNFVTTARIARYAQELGIDVDFAKGCMLSAIQRLDSDPQFRTRHQNSFAGRVIRFMQIIGVANLLGKLPPSLASPMIFSCRRKTT